MSLHILRLDHRPVRDSRITTHVFLTARAFGAAGAYYTGTRDPAIEETLMEVQRSWGGKFYLEFTKDRRGLIDIWKKQGKIVHLTMYGLPIQEIIHVIREDPSEKLIVVGGAKVPKDVYDLADWNIAVTSQPHSEVSALAVFLHELFESRELEIGFDDAKLKVVPQAHGKRVDVLGVV